MYIQAPFMSSLLKYKYAPFAILGIFQIYFIPDQSIITSLVGLSF